MLFSTQTRSRERGGEGHGAETRALQPTGHHCNSGFFVGLQWPPSNDDATNVPFAVMLLAVRRAAAAKRQRPADDGQRQDDKTTAQQLALGSWCQFTGPAASRGDRGPHTHVRILIRI